MNNVCQICINNFEKPLNKLKIMEKVLVNKQTEDLVRGEYSAVEAREIVSNLISQKNKLS